jgi:hypothetical protein
MARGPAGEGPDTRRDAPRVARARLASDARCWTMSKIVQQQRHEAEPAVRGQTQTEGGHLRFMLVQNYAPIEGVPPITQWTPDEVNAHIAFQRGLNERLEESGELVEIQALAGPAAATIVTATDDGPPVITDGPFPESKEFLAGFRIIDVTTRERAIEIAAIASAAPGPAAQPIRQPVEIREVLQ